MKRLLSTGSLFLVLAGLVMAQYRHERDRKDGSPGTEIRTAREMPNDARLPAAPIWENPPAFAKDVFTFARIRYSSGGGYLGRGEMWSTDAPESDLNLS